MVSENPPKKRRRDYDVPLEWSIMYVVCMNLGYREYRSIVCCLIFRVIVLELYTPPSTLVV